MAHGTCTSHSHSHYEVVPEARSRGESRSAVAAPQDTATLNMTATAAAQEADHYMHTLILPASRTAPASTSSPSRLAGLPFPAVRGHNHFIGRTCKLTALHHAPALHLIVLTIIMFMLMNQSVRTSSMLCRSMHIATADQPLHPALPPVVGISYIASCDYS